MKQVKRILFLLFALSTLFFNPLDAQNRKGISFYTQHKKLLIRSGVFCGSTIFSLLIVKLIQQRKQKRELQEIKNKLTKQIISFKKSLEQQNTFLSHELLKLPSLKMKQLKHIQSKINNLLNSQEKTSIEQELNSLMMQNSAEWMMLIKKYIPGVENDEACLAVFKSLQSGKKIVPIFYKNFIGTILLFERYQEYLSDVLTGIENKRNKIDQEKGNTALELIQQLREKIAAQQTKFDSFFQEHCASGTCARSTLTGVCEESCYQQLYLLIVGNLLTNSHAHPEHYHSTAETQDAFRTGEYYINLFAPEIKKIHETIDSYPCCICFDDKSKSEILFFSGNLHNQTFLCKTCHSKINNKQCPFCRRQMNINNHSIKCE